MIAFNLACYASVTGRMEEAKEHLRRAIDLDKDVRKLAIFYKHPQNECTSVDRPRGTPLATC
jgi:hypothetical protein